MNGVSFVPPSAPVLLQILNGSHTAQSLMPKGSVIELPANKVALPPQWKSIEPD
jgi:iron transport multicopper oxidase